MPSSQSRSMPSPVTLSVNGSPVAVPAGATVAVAVAMAGKACRICFECRVSINGRRHCRSCQIVCEPGMEVKTEVKANG